MFMQNGRLHCAIPRAAALSALPASLYLPWPPVSGSCTGLTQSRYRPTGAAGRFGQRRSQDQPSQEGVRLQHLSLRNFKKIHYDESRLRIIVFMKELCLPRNWSLPLSAEPLPNIFGDSGAEGDQVAVPDVFERSRTKCFTQLNTITREDVSEISVKDESGTAMQ